MLCKKRNMLCKIRQHMKCDVCFWCVNAKIHVLCNCAHIYVMHARALLTKEDWNWAIELNWSVLLTFRNSWPWTCVYFFASYFIVTSPISWHSHLVSHTLSPCKLSLSFWQISLDWPAQAPSFPRAYAHSIPPSTRHCTHILSLFFLPPSHMHLRFLFASVS